MFEFELSEDLVRRIVDNLRFCDIALPDLYPKRDVEQLRAGWGKGIVGTLGIYAQRTRYACYANPAKDVAADRFTFIENGGFPKEIADHVGGDVPIPEGAAGDRLMTEIADEFLVWVREHGNTIALHPMAPITRLAAEGRDVVAYVRPRDPPMEDPNFVQATVLE